MEFPEDDHSGRNPFEFQHQKSIFPEEFGRESLGILDFSNENFGRDSLSFDLGRESLGILNLNPIDLGRESLGITAINLEELPPIFISDVTKDTTNFSELNRGFLTSKESKSGSTFSSLGSLFSTSSHYSVASALSTISLGLQTDERTHNDAFRVSSNYATMSCLVPPSGRNDNKMTRRICSAPGDLERENEIIPQLRTCDTHFDDAVFIEGSHLAAKIRDGSFYELGSEEVDHNLDSIQAPENFVYDESDPQSSGETSSIISTVDNQIDKIFLTPIPLQEVINLESLPKTSSENSSKTKSPLEALQSLSNILSQDEFTDKQKFEGKLLINSLAELMLANRDTPSSSNDSGHSSIEEQPLNLVCGEKCYEVLDLQKSTSTKQFDKQQPLDLSLKSKGPDKVFVSPKILPRKFNMSQPKNYSISSNESSNDSGRFKIRKAEPNKLVKGPMKATIQLDHTGKDNGALIIPKSKSRKTTSTPIRGHTLPEPVAHSTPDNPSSSTNKSKDDSPILSKGRINYSPVNSLSKAQNDSKTKIKKPEIKRRSFTDLRTTESCRVKFTRSYSMGEKPAVTKTSKVPPTKISYKTEELKKKQENILKENLRPRLSGSAMTVGKKLGKENIKRFNI